MWWIAAVDVRYREVAANRLSAFNTEAKNRNAKWKAAAYEDGLARMGESNCLDHWCRPV